MPYNPDIANTFFRAGEIEAWGRGIDRIITACKNDGFSTTFKFEYPERATTQYDQNTTQKTTQKTAITKSFLCQREYFQYLSCPVGMIALSF